MLDTIICPGCGWTGTVETLACPDCGYENGLEPYRLLTLSEMLEGEGIYDDVSMDLFLKSLFKVLGYDAKTALTEIQQREQSYDLETAKWMAGL